MVEERVNVVKMRVLICMAGLEDYTEGETDTENE